jgi:hypothetical protein
MEPIKMTDNTIPCPACGGPNQAIPGAARMACTFCGTNLTIPEELRAKAAPRMSTTPPRINPIATPKPEPQPTVDAPDLLRKAQPIALGAWNAFAAWTWLRRLLPGCLIALVLLCLACIALGGLPFLLRSIQ